MNGADLLAEGLRDSLRSAVDVVALARHFGPLRPIHADTDREALRRELDR